ncbi:MAG: ABC transporter ATP-binding protein, partial [Betaproteobacteria bacterium]|nr:ABC transporter ATP-binding protein [Betaproteobacteria bacterium]
LDLYNQPANEFVAGFLGTPRINLIPRPESNTSPSHRALWEALVPVDGSGIHCAGLRAEHMGLGSAAAGIPATVVLAEHLGDASVLHLRIEGLEELLRAKTGAAHSHIGAGQTVALKPDAAWALRFDANGQRVD